MPVQVLDAAQPGCVSSRDGDAGPASYDARARRVTAGSASLLVVDGHVDAAESLGLLLESIGHRVHLAHDAATTLALVAATPIDAAVLAIDLPDLDGYALARRLRELGRPRVLVALTGYGRPDDRRRALEAGFDDHVLKPATLEQLANVLARCLAGDVR
jgi:CheY-like chemotaxis protein